MLKPKKVINWWSLKILKVSLVNPATNAIRERFTQPYDI